MSPAITNGREIKAEVVERFDRQLAELDWLASQMVDGLALHQDASEEVQLLEDIEAKDVPSSANLHFSQPR